ncbi:hypothetical protein KKA00_02395 [bacterium]|nr:hypothetical protein [bacterium]MBU1651044.1 hypothetical protein [bacterium]
MSQAVKQMRELRDQTFKMICKMSFEERLGLIRLKVEEAKLRLPALNEETGGNKG